MAGFSQSDSVPPANRHSTNIPDSNITATNGRGRPDELGTYHKLCPHLCLYL